MYILSRRGRRIPFPCFPSIRRLGIAFFPWVTGRNKISSATSPSVAPSFVTDTQFYFRDSRQTTDDCYQKQIPKAVFSPWEQQE